MKWYQELGLKKNPFETNPFKLKDLDSQFLKEPIKELLYRVNAGNMVLIRGSEDSGKSSLLKIIIDKFQGEGKVVYLDGKNLSKRINIEKILTRNQGFIKNVFGKKPVNMILLLDNVQYLSSKNAERIKYFYDQNYLKSVVFTTTNQSGVKFQKSIIDRIGKRIIVLKKPLFNDVLKITQERLKSELILNTVIIREIFKISDENLKEHLRNCEVVLSHLVKKDKDFISVVELKKLFDKKKILKKTKETSISEKCDFCGKKLQKIKSFWRCPDCDTYCLKCGAIVSPKDKVCPLCGVNFLE
ncbi:MAG: AAA family ATPase [Nanoarchaeota archaeon]|nr:hypothetical protein [Nanoarchaeota archaeon]MBU1030913.1 hypothetical protein [Nanoarchaeota archaeon]MBU1850694.1 hypothetical protein [Nanoarchaeota archaeon]